MFTRGYVTITRLVTPADPGALGGWFAGRSRRGSPGTATRAPRGSGRARTPLVGFDLTTRRDTSWATVTTACCCYTHEGKAWVHAAGTWDPMPSHLERAYRVGGQAMPSMRSGARATSSRLSLLHQLALAIA